MREPGNWSGPEVLTVQPGPRRNRQLLASVVVGALLLVVGAAAMQHRSGQDSQPTPAVSAPPTASSPPRPLNPGAFSPMPSRRLPVTGFSFSSPAGWSISSPWDGTQLELIDWYGDEIRLVRGPLPAGQEGGYCDVVLHGTPRGSLRDTYSTLPKRNLGGIVATGTRLVNDNVLTTYCAQRHDAVYLATFTAAPAYADQAAVGFTGVLDSWRWE